MATVASATPLRRGLAFLAGIGFAAVPTVGPYLAILGAATGRVALQRADRWWWGAAVLLGLPWVLTGHVWAGLGATGQALAVWLIFRSASALRRVVDPDTFPRDVGAGLLVGFAGAIALGLERAGTWRPDTARSVFDLVAWTGSPALYGHAMLVLAALLAVVLPSPRGRVLALALGAVAVLVSGAQEAVLAWLVIAVGLRFVGRRGGRAIAVAEWTLIAVMVLVAAGATSLLGIGRTGFRIDLGPDPAGRNLFQGAEVANGPWWYPLGVDVAARAATVAGEPRTVYDVTKAGADPWSRLQQIVRLEPGQAYVISVAWQAGADAAPGLDGWGRATSNGPAATLAATWRDGAWTAVAGGPVAVLGTRLASTGDGWSRGQVVFRYEGGEALVWYVGAVPDRRTTVGATTTFAELDLYVGTTPRPYVPTPPDRGLADLRTTRFPLWSVAIEGIAARPWLGWGPGGYPTALAALDPTASRQRAIAAHAHSLVLDTWLERGLVGLFGLLAFAAALALRAVQQRDRAMLVVLAGVALLGAFETTLWNGAVVYPLAAVLGWRAVGRRSAAGFHTGAASALAVRIVLAAGDAAVGLVALFVASAITRAAAFAPPAFEWPAAVVYATLLWPALAWRARLYPGYGMAPHEELARSVSSATGASIAFGFLALLAPAEVPFGGPAVLLVLAVSALLAPLVRALLKGALRGARLWGRPVAILGGGPAAELIARHLLEQPGIGLRPVAAFGEGAWSLAALPRTGGLDVAWQAIPRLGVEHVIAVPDTTTPVGFDEVLRRLGRRVRTIQLVPDLQGVPMSAVRAAPIGTTPALEAQNRLASRTNRTVKRAFDVVAVVVGGILISPLLLALAVAIRLDSPGPVLYRQRRIGRGGRAFFVWKFRSMVRDADARLAELLQRDPRARAEWDATHKLVDDPRVTRVGRLLRRTSLDELPQLLNVLAGDMSLVGPRPIVDAEAAKYGDAFELYTQVRPGMTGAWQVSGRSDTSYDYRVALDASYVRNWNVWLDIEILLRTVGVVLRREGAY